MDDLQGGGEQVGMRGEQQAQGDRKGQHPLPHWHPRDDVIDQVGSLQEKATSFSWAPLKIVFVTANCGLQRVMAKG